MRGITHAPSGPVAYLLVLPHLPGVGTVTPLAAAVGSFAALAAATMPDLDHPSSTVARTFGLPGRAGAALVSAVSGGHRGAVHSLLGAAVAYAATAAAVNAGGWWATGTLALVLAFGASALGHRAGWLAAALVVVAVLTGRAAGFDPLAAMPWTALPLAVACGWIAHLLGDDQTHARVRWFWPLKWRRPKVLTITTGGRLDRLARVLFWLAATGLLVEATGATPYFEYPWTVTP